MGKLNLLHHKSYHPYKAENIAKVKRDEAKARGEEEERDRRVLVAESEARMDRLRRKSDKKKRKEEGNEGENALDRQLSGRAQVEEEEQEVGGTMIVRPEKQEVAKPGHINFWEEFEGSAAMGKTVGPSVAAKLEKQLEKEKLESITKMYLGKNGENSVGWYASVDGKSEKERKEGVEVSLERAYKDGEHKKLSDPLSLMNEYLKKRDQIKAGHTSSSRPSPSYHHERYPTPSSSRNASTSSVVEPSLLLPRRRKGDPIPPSTSSSLPPPPGPSSYRAGPSSDRDVKQEASSRATSERARAAALIAAARKGNSTPSSVSSASETPRSEYGGYSMYNRSETREAKLSWKDMKRGRDEGRGGGGWRSR